MATDVVRASWITVAIARDPALVRTVRLVAAAVARRSSDDEEFVEEVRLAAGEACALLIGAGHTEDEPVTVRLNVDSRLRVEVRSEGPAAPQDGISGDVDGVEPWLLLRGLVDDFSLTQDGPRTIVSMSWPVP
ncbi:MAG: ATP-binding protein [Nocardioidaceae bacterium]|nr:ATP-binding protein [Nocardioidaceae bacterium]